MRPDDLISGLWQRTAAPDWSARQWELALAQARSSRLGARVGLLFEERGWLGQVPPPCRVHLHSAVRYGEMLRRDVLREVRHLARALRGVDTRVVLLKGAAYVAAGLPPGRGRLFSDIDLLVERAALRDVELALLAAGWVAEELDPYDDRYYRQWMHELPPLRHVQRNSWLDVHHTLAPPTSRFVIDGAQMLARAVPVDVPLPSDGAPLFVLAPPDQVLHSVLHLMQEGDFGSGVRDLLDVHDLLVHFGSDPAFWPALARRADELALQPLLALALAQIRRLFAYRPPEGPVPAAAWALPATASARVLQQMLSRAIRPPLPIDTTLYARLVREALYIRSHWLRMPWYQILPHLARKSLMRLTLRWKKDAGAEAKERKLPALEEVTERIRDNGRITT